jgi:plastocyanin
VPEYWIQIENRAWDAAPWGVDRMTGRLLTQDPATQMFAPVGGPGGEALILRRYTADWGAPDDRKVNPWDVNEPDPTATGGTIPGPTLECAIGEEITVHFRNADNRGNATLLDKTHSLHPHVLTFHAVHDGAYPLSPLDRNQPVEAAEAAAWAQVGVASFKKGDRVPPGATFTYHWDTHSWPTTAGVWLYHDHSPGDMSNVNHGAIGLLVVHNTNDPDDVTITDADTAELPGGSPNGSPIRPGLLGFTAPAVVNHVDIEGLGGRLVHLEHRDAAGVVGGPDEVLVGDQLVTVPPDLVIKPGSLMFAATHDSRSIIGVLLPHYRTPPSRAQYLLLFHDLAGVSGMCINGRVWLGNTPTVVGGPQTVMRFGVIGMGDFFHTFHLHGHRWTLTGPDGTDFGSIQGSPQVRAVTQFEDTRTFGPANSFAFTIREGTSFMGAPPEPAAGATGPGSLGEWHMHCHVLGHMMTGMMGSLLIVQGGEVAGQLPRGTTDAVPVPTPTPTPTPTVHDVSIHDLTFDPSPVSVRMGDVVRWTNNDTVFGQHTVTSDAGSPQSFDSGALDPVASGTAAQFQITVATMQNITYHCEFHGGMSGTIQVSM